VRTKLLERLVGPRTLRSRITDDPDLVAAFSLAARYVEDVAEQPADGSTEDMENAELVSPGPSPAGEIRTSAP
jgi:hypothetical protein